jgi:hypothetical protein
MVLEIHPPNLSSPTLKNKPGQGTVVYTCNPSYMGGGDLGGLQFETRLAKKKIIIKIARPHLNKPGMMAHTYIPSYAGGIGRRIEVEAGLRQKQ